MDFSDVVASAGVQRFFRARQKLIEPGFISHITQRAAGKDILFLEDGDYLLFLSLLKEVTERYEFDFFAFCLMQNHVHLLLRPKKKNLDQAMRHLFSSYATVFNKKYQRRGHLFGGPYRQAVCLEKTYLLAASVYIHLNPVRVNTGIAAKDYPWSSCRLYLQLDQPSSFVQTDFILNLLSQDEKKSRKAYAGILSKGKEVDLDNVLEQEQAVERLVARLGRLFPNFLKKIAPRISGADKEKPAWADMLDLEQMINELRSGNIQGGPETRRARKYLVEQLTARGFKQQEICQRLGVCRKTVYNYLNR